MLHCLLRVDCRGSFFAALVPMLHGACLKHKCLKNLFDLTQLLRHTRTQFAVTALTLSFSSRVVFNSNVLHCLPDIACRTSLPPTPPCGRLPLLYAYTWKHVQNELIWHSRLNSLDNMPRKKISSYQSARRSSSRSMCSHAVRFSRSELHNLDISFFFCFCAFRCHWSHVSYMGQSVCSEPAHNPSELISTTHF